MKPDTPEIKYVWIDDSKLSYPGLSPEEVRDLTDIVNIIADNFYDSLRRRRDETTETISERDN